MQSWQFAQPEWAHLLWVFLLGWWLARRFPGGQDDLTTWRQLRQLTVRHPLAGLFSAWQGAGEITDRDRQDAGSHTDRRYRQLLGGLRGVLLIGGVLVLMEPGRVSMETQRVERTGALDLAYVMETSVTVLLRDYEDAEGRAISRMEAVRAALKASVESMEKSRFSLTVFADRAAVLLPLTQDTGLFGVVIDRLQPYLMGRTDEGSGEALALALRFRPQAVVLISDGLNRPSVVSLTDVVAYARLHDIPIFTIGVGAGQRKASDSGQAGLIYQPLAEEGLKQLAALTGGHYQAIHGADSLRTALNAIVRTRQQHWTEQVTRRHWRSYQAEALQIWLGMLALYVLLSMAFGWQQGERRHGTS